MTKARVLTAILLLCWQGPAVAQSAGAAARMIPFDAVETPEARAAARAAAEAALVEDLVLHRCTPDREWCAQLLRDGVLALALIARAVRTGPSGASLSSRRTGRGRAFLRALAAPPARSRWRGDDRPARRQTNRLFGRRRDGDAPDPGAGRARRERGRDGGDAARARIGDDPRLLQRGGYAAAAAGLP